jgi:glutamate-ammonia-ligase adenylyltransferase
VSLESQTEAQWAEWCDRARELGLELPDKHAFAVAAKRVWEASNFVVQACRLEPALLSDLVNSGHLEREYAPGELSSRLEKLLAGVTDELQLGKRLREFRRQEMVRIIWRDVAGWASLEETLETLSELADQSISQALRLLYPWTCQEMGTPRNKRGDAQPLVVLGMGKLGARELNLSSDIDLIFAYPERGETDAPRSKTNEQFFIRLCQRLIQALDSVNADGFVFRVDTRLRPFGGVGPLAMNFDAMESYYASQAREWERYAMIKARVVAVGSLDSDNSAADNLMNMLRPFVYRRYLDFGAIESLRDMKGLISRELHKKGMEANIKLGPGGIREIEFIGQAFQLIRGGRDEELQIRPIVPVLILLQQKGLLPEYVVRELIEAYEFLRLTENRIQAWEDKQTHLLPNSEEVRLRLARAMDFPDWLSFEAELEAHRKRVQGHFDKVFAAPQTETGEENLSLQAVWQETAERERAEKLLVGAGFDDPCGVLTLLEQFRTSHASRALGVKGRQRMNQLMPLLLEAAGQLQTDTESLQRVFGLLESISRRTAYIALLVENPLALSQLVRLSGVSPWIAKLLTRQPILLDELLDPRRLYSPLKRQELEEELTLQLSHLQADDLEQQMERLRHFVQNNLLRVAAADITERIPLMVVSDYLTEIAETTIAHVVSLAWDEMVKRHGKPEGLADGETGFAVVGYGKLGGIELGYGSDLDMVFIHGIDNQFANTDGEKPIPVDVFYARMAQRIIHIFTTRTPAGILYEVDMRLRPNGNSGMMVSSMKAFETYQSQSAWTWEHQALVRARVVAGDEKVNARFEAVRRRIINESREDVSLRDEVVKMREKMRDNLDKSDTEHFDLKQGRGGIVDIEFMVQYLVLRWAEKYSELLTWTDNIRLLETLSRLGLLDVQRAGPLMDAYRSLRAAYHRNALQDLPPLIEGQRLTGERAVVREVWGELMAEN